MPASDTDIGEVGCLIFVVFIFGVTAWGVIPVLFDCKALDCGVSKSELKLATSCNEPFAFLNASCCCLNYFTGQSNMQKEDGGSHTSLYVCNVSSASRKTVGLPSSSKQSFFND